MEIRASWKAMLHPTQKKYMVQIKCQQSSSSNVLHFWAIFVPVRIVLLVQSVFYFSNLWTKWIEWMEPQKRFAKKGTKVLGFRPIKSKAGINKRGYHDLPGSFFECYASEFWNPNLKILKNAITNHEIHPRVLRCRGTPPPKKNLPSDHPQIFS